MFRLYLFDITHGGPTAFKYLREQLGLAETAALSAALAFRAARKNPFAEVNRREKPDAGARFSQHQMAPVILLYELLRERQYVSVRALELLGGLMETVALEFLQYNIPLINPADFKDQTRAQKERFLNRVAGRFGNAETEPELLEGDRFRLPVTKCWFAYYSRLLGYPELGPLFCAADELYFKSRQPYITFKRTKTLAKDETPCDFYFEPKEK